MTPKRRAINLSWFFTGECDTENSVLLVSVTEKICVASECLCDPENSVLLLSVTQKNSVITGECDPENLVLRASMLSSKLLCTVSSRCSCYSNLLRSLI